MNEVAVRGPRRGDGEALARAWVDAGRYYAELDPERFQVPAEEGLVEAFEKAVQAEPAENERFLVAEIDGRVVGYIDAHLEPPRDDAPRELLREVGQVQLVIDAVIVAREYWRRGAGTALMRAVEDWARERGATVAMVDTYVESPVSVPFYERRMGYVPKSLHLRKPLG